MSIRRYFVPMLIFSFISTIILSCSKEEDEPIVDQTGKLYLKFNFTGNGEPLKMNAEFDDPLGRKLTSSLLKFYVSNVYAISSAGEKKMLDVDLVTRFEEGSSDPNAVKTTLECEVQIGSYNQFRLGIGLDEETNNTDPNDPSLPLDHPLSSDRNTHWGQWSLYRFVMLEGRVDTSNLGSATTIYGFHTGFNEMYREKTFDVNYTVSQTSMDTIELTLEYNDIFFGKDTLDMANDRTWHGTDTSYTEPARIISDNFIDALNLK